MTILEIDRMHHAVPVQRIDIVIGLKGHVGPVAHEGAQQFLGYLALNCQLLSSKIPLFVDRRIVALQIGKGTQIHASNLGLSQCLLMH